MKYESMLDPDLPVADALFGFLGLEPTTLVRRRFVGARAKAEQLRTTRRAPNPEIEQWLAQRVDPAIEQRWDTRFRRALHRFAPTS